MQTSELEAYYIKLARALISWLADDSLDEQALEKMSEMEAFLNDNISHSVSGIMNLDNLTTAQRQEMLHTLLERLQLSMDTLDQLNDPNQAIDALLFLWNQLYEPALNNLGAISSYLEFTEDNFLDFNKMLMVPEGVWLLFFIESGQAVIQHDGATQTVSSNDLLLFPPNCPVSINRHPECQNLKLFGSGFYPKEDWIERIQICRQGNAFGHVNASSPVIRRMVSDAFSEIIDVAHSSLELKQHIHTLLIEKIILLFQELSPKTETPALDSRVTQACNFIREHYADKLSLEQIASAANTSPSTLSTLFKNQLGTNVVRWRDQIRIEKAKAMLNGSDLPIKQIALAVGYEDQLFFSRRFKKITGWSPSQLRSRAQSPN